MRYLLTCLSVIVFAMLPAQNINLYPDSLHAPFIYGIASGDPTASAIVLWTAVEPLPANQGMVINWQLAADSNFTNVLYSGQNPVDSNTGYVFKVDVGGLQPNTHYYYRFSYNGAFSDTGFTLTAPNTRLDSLSFAVISCSSLFSGYFNAYRQISRLGNLNAVIHLGDFIYDFVDPQERVRIPQPEPPNPVTQEDWRNRYRLYCLDPDQRAARKRLPFIQIWDNHDVKKGGSVIRENSFEEFNPLRMPSTDTARDWRVLSYGPMVDIIMIDMNTFPAIDTFASGAQLIMPAEEYQWLLNKLDSSQAQWKLIGNGKMFSPWNLGPFAGLVPGGFGNTWSGYTENRDSLLAHIERKSINNVVIISGDEHMNISSDLTRNPFDSTVYNPTTGAGSLGVEMMGTSISRGNLDEAGVPISNAPTINKMSLDSNPHQVYNNLFDHGYDIMTFTTDSMTTRMMLCPILTLTDAQRMDIELVCRNNDNHWVRPLRTTGIDEPAQNYRLHVYPNPAKTYLRLDLPTTQPLQTEIINVHGQVVQQNKNTNNLSIQSLPAGVYIVVAKQAGKTFAERFVKE